ncbi:MAG: hypothetical protein ACJ790_19245 [Myxococcaceae bacterium]
MKRRISSALLTAGLLSSMTGCIESALNPTDPVAVSGSALNEDKTPLANADLILGRSDNSTCALIVSNFATVKTDGHGAWSWKGTGADTQNGDLARCFRISLPTATDESYAQHDYLVQITDVKVPALQRWTGQPAVAQTANGATITFKPISDSQTISADGSPNFFLKRSATGSDLWWRVINPQGSITLSDEVLEEHADLKGQLIVYGQVKGSGTTFKSQFDSATAAVTGHGKVPASRGATCSFIETQPCKLTDGDAAQQVESGDKAPMEAKITLAAPKLLKKAVFRNFTVGVNAKSITIEGSSDGTTFTQLAQVTDAAVIGSAFFEVPLTGTAAVSQVRIKSTDQSNNPNRLTGASEISLFE